MHECVGEEGLPSGVMNIKVYKIIMRTYTGHIRINESVKNNADLLYLIPTVKLDFKFCIKAFSCLQRAVDGVND